MVQVVEEATGRTVTTRQGRDHALLAGVPGVGAILSFGNRAWVVKKVILADGGAVQCHVAPILGGLVAEMSNQ